ncbi:Pectin lyase fold/virulence factor [Pseudocohnilembus persalinus]|uniref:Pectin lyase fold/virulence factor n=1 Tax=Pseudocohnilembus persalinus TaxID=266149 RepID=A0A0V0R755_PSEPJ|nr:Pectin lyase fold/virulence factor [Pseudocohnilembus persalinus]|eukprot:KRX10337.1 Pectin lyase fold/virulence factor [Pseudocohnilembus persalinus]
MTENQENVYLNNNQDIQINNTQFIQNSQNFNQVFGGGIYIINFQNLFLDNSYFEDNNALNYGSAIYIYLGEYASITNTNFTNNQLNLTSIGKGGGIYAESLDEMLIINCNFLNNTANQNGGAVYAFDIQKLDVQSSKFVQNSAGRGAGIYTEMINKIMVQYSNFTLNFVSSFGGGIYANGQQTEILTDIIVTNNYFSNNTAARGGGIYILQYSMCTECLIQENYYINGFCTGFGGGGIFIENSSDFVLKYNQYINNDCLFTDFYSFAGGACMKIVSNAIVESEYLEKNKADNSGGMAILQSDFPQVYNVTLFDNYADYGGGLSVYQSSNIYLNTLVFEKNSAVYIGGLDQWASNYIYISNVIFNNNEAVLGAAGGLIYSCSIAEVNNATTFDNYAQSKAGIGVEYSSNILIKNSIFYQNSADKGGGGLQLIGLTNITLINITLYENQAFQGGGIYGNDITDLWAEDMVMYNNHAENWGAAINLQAVNNGTFKNMIIYQNQVENKNGGGLYLTLSVEIVLVNSHFYQNDAAVGGGVYLDDVQGLYMQNNTIYDNKAKNSDGGIAFYSIGNGEINDLFIFNNESGDSVGGIQISVSHNLKFNNTQVYNCRSTLYGGIYINEESENLQFFNLNLYDNQAQQYGGGIRLDQVLNINFINSNIFNNIAETDGTQFYITESGTVYFDNCLIQQTNATKSVKFIPQRGGVIYANDIDILHFYKTSIQNTQAQYYGGGIYLENIDQTIFNSSQIINSTLTMNDFHIESMGGGLYAKNINKFTIIDGLVQNCSSYLMGAGLYLLNTYQIEMLNSNFDLNKVTFNESIGLFEKNENYVLSQGGSIYFELSKNNVNKRIQINLKKLTFSNSAASSGASALFNLPPQANYDFTVQEIKLIKNKADIGTGIRFLGKYTENFQQLVKQQIQSKDCKGHIVEDLVFFGYYDNEYQINKDTSYFKICELDRYLVQGDHEYCVKCVDNGVCEGGYIPVYPKPGYWRAAIESKDDISLCSNEEWCLGNDTCKEGFTGVLCEVCDKLNDYETQGDGCSKCGSIGIILLKVFFYYICALIILTYQVYALNKKIQRRLISKSMLTIFDLPFMKVPLMTGLIKITVTHFQILQIITDGLGFQLPYQAVNTAQIIGYPNQIFSMSVSCLWKLNSKQTLEKFHYLVILYGFLISFSVLVILQAILFYLKQKKVFHTKPQYVSIVKCAFICYQLLMLPSVIQFCLEFMFCKEVSEKKYSLGDSNIQCDSNFYKYTIVPINTVLLVLIAFVVPMILNFKIRKMQKLNKLDDLNFSKKYGIIFSEYKKKHYYWEQVITYLKLILQLKGALSSQQVLLVQCPFNILAINYILHNI